MASVETMPIPKISEREQFLANRRRFIGGSDAASMFNAGPYACHRALVWDKQGKQGIPPTPEEQRLFDRGNHLEPVVADLFVQDTGLRVRRQQSRMRCPSCGLRVTYTYDIKKTPDCLNCGAPVCAGVNMDRQILGASLEDLDRVFGQQFPWFIERLREFGGNHGPGYLEIKTANEFSFKSNDENGLPEQYIFQTQEGIGVADYKWGIWAELAPTWFERRYFPFIRNEELITEIMLRCAETWQMVLGNAPLPPRLPDEANEACAGCKFRKDCREEAYIVQVQRKIAAAKHIETDETPELVELVSDLVQIQSARKSHEEAEDTAKKLLKARLGDRQKVAVPATGKRVDFADQQGGEKWDTKALDAILPDLPAEVRDKVADCKMRTPGNRPLVLRELKSSEVA